FCERPGYDTGTVIDWKKGRTGNVLLKMRIFDGVKEAFKPELLTGEDQDFFRRMIENGYVFVWCKEALAYEVVPPGRWKRSFMLRRALFRGKISIRQKEAGAFLIPKSIVALPIYFLSLPFMLLLGQH